MAYSYLDLVNRVLKDYNEVQLTSTTFNTAVGFHAAVKDYINSALNDIYTWHDMEWPFLWAQKTFNTTVGTGEYSYDVTVGYVNWDSFNIKRRAITVTSLTQAAGVATCTISAGHQLLDNDSVIIQGATQTDYNGTFAATVTSATTFTYTIANSSATSPATGTITIIPPYSNKYLTLKNYDEYLRNWRDIDINADLQVVEQNSVPNYIIRKPDNNFIVSPYPNRIFTVGYDAFVLADELSAYTDVPLVPALFKQVIIDRASIYVLAFRDNDMQLLRNDKKFEDNCHRMRRILIPQTEYIIAK